MKVLLDAQLSPAIEADLVRRGLDAEAVNSRQDIADDASDTDIFGLAAAEGRAVATNNIKDFRPIAAARLLRGQSHAGLILIPSSRPRTRAAAHDLADAIERVMLANPGGLVDSERWI